MLLCCRGINDTYLSIYLYIVNGEIPIQDIDTDMDMTMDIHVSKNEADVSLLYKKNYL
jgi:hypothetical protein